MDIHSTWHWRRKRRAMGAYIQIQLYIGSLPNDFWKVGPDPCGSDHFPILKGFKDGSWRRQTGINSSIYAALVCNNLPLQMLMIPCLSSLPSWRTLQKKLFLRLWQYQNVSINHGFLTFAKMQSKSATGPLRGSNVNQPRVTWMPIALLGLRLAEISDTLRKHLGEIMSPRWILKHRLNLFGIESVKIKGKDTSNTVHHLSVIDRDVTSHRDIANALADNFSHTSSSAFSTDAFASVRKKAEKQTIKFSSDNAEVYNKPLSMEELRDALRRAYATSAGPDEIHYQLLKHLPDASLLLLLNILHKIWLSGDFPSDWRKAIVIPIPKPGKDPTNPTNYRPIALTSCICKTMERMINRRLVWYLESHKLLTNVQCGFRSKRSTVDHLVRFETFCREAFIHNQHLVSVFFDLEKAYDTTWKYKIMKDLHGFGLRGRLPIFISNFLQDRSFKVRVVSTFSDSHPQEMGVPQGSILSVTLFSVTARYMSMIFRFATDRPTWVSLNVSCSFVWINFSNGQLTTVFNSQRQKLSVCISARKEVSI